MMDEQFSARERAILTVLYCFTIVWGLLTGIFGFVLGGLLGVVYALTQGRISKRASRTVLVAAAISLLLGVLGALFRVTGPPA